MKSKLHIALLLVVISSVTIFLAANSTRQEIPDPCMDKDACIQTEKQVALFPSLLFF